MTQLNHFYFMRKQFNDRLDRYIDMDDTDLYLPTTRLPSFQVTGFKKIYYAIMHMRTNRLKKLLNDTHNDKNMLDYSIFDQDYYKRNIIGLITEPNFPSNIDYWSNIHMYEEMFFTVLKNIRPDHLSKLFSDLCTNEVSYGDLQIDAIFKVLSDRPHMLIALWNFGLKYTTEHTKKYEFKPLVNMLNKYANCGYTPGMRYYLLSHKCPLSHKFIRKPAILTDGVMYEYEYIKKYLEQLDISPVTGEKLMAECNSRFKTLNSKLIGIDVSAKTLYLPEENRFEYFPLLTK